MIRPITLAVTALTLSLTIVGCAQNDNADDPGYAVADDGLAVRATADLAVARPGDTIPVTVTVENTSGDPIHWKARNTAPVIVRLQEQSPVGENVWQDVKKYPQAAGMAITPHRYEPGQEKTYTMNIPVEPDWPRGEVVRLAVHPNGREDVIGTIKMKIPAADETDE